MTKTTLVAGVGAAAFAMGLALAGPQASGVASADSGDTDGSSVSTGPAGGSASRSSSTGNQARTGSHAARSGGRASASMTAGTGSGVVDAPSRSARPAAAVASPTSAPAAAVAVSQPAVPAAQFEPVAGALLRGSVPVARAAQSTVVPLTVSGPVPAAAAQQISIGAAQTTPVSAPMAAASTAVQTSTPPVITAVNAAITNLFDSTASWLAGLPASPLTEAIGGGLWLLRRELFNQVPVARPDKYLTTDTGQFVGTLGAFDFEADALTYTLTQAPQFGTVEIDSHGTYTYTPGENYAGTDVFTVAVSDGGFNVLTPFAAHQTIETVHVPCARGIAGPGAAASASASASIGCSGISAGNVMGGIYQALGPGDYLESSNGSYRLVMRADGNLVLYQMAGTKKLWSTGTAGKPIANPNSVLRFRDDGDLTIQSSYWAEGSGCYDHPESCTPVNATVWSSGTSGNPNAFLYLTDRGAIEIWNEEPRGGVNIAKGPIWTAP